MNHGVQDSRLILYCLCVFFTDVSSDTCNVMKGARGGVIAKLKEKQAKVIDVHCMCHVVNLCVKAATKVLPLKVDELLVDIYYHFHYSVNRITSLKEYAEFCCVEFKRVLKHCDTRWLSLTRAVNCTLEMWEPHGVQDSRLILYCLCVFFTDVSSETSSTSGVNHNKHIADQSITTCEAHGLSDTQKILQPFKPL